MDSIFKSKSDKEKFDLARKLKRKVKSIRERYEKDLESDNIKLRQLATATYLIDNLALRVGGKKDSKEEADTVGVTSLRVEHIELKGDNTLKLDFLGKDSIRFCKKIKVTNSVYNNLVMFFNNKKKKDSLFDLISYTNLNEYLEEFMKGLTSKVFRTYNASNVFQKELDKVNPQKLEKIHESERINYLITFFNQANTAVALLCNHQKNISSSLSNQIDKIDDKIKMLKKKRVKLESKKKKDHEKLEKVKSKIKLVKLKKQNKLMMKNVSLGTSKTNYIDPRIIFAFIKKYDLPPEKLFTKTLLDRFKWAQEVDKNYRF
jgi:DNA topoisomerase-1